MWQKYTEELHKKDLDELDNDYGVVTYLESDILQYEVNGTLRSITMNKASGGDGIPAELFKILKDDAVKGLHSIVSKFGKPSRDHRTGKGKFSFKFQIRVVLKNVQTARKLCLHMGSKKESKGIPEEPLLPFL